MQKLKFLSVLLSFMLKSIISKIEKQIYSDSYIYNVVVDNSIIRKPLLKVYT